MPTEQKTILIVEDEKSFRDLISSKLQNAGYNIIFSETSEDAVEKTKEFKPDLILIDIILPGIGGFETLEQIIREIGEENVPHVIVISDSGDDIEANKVLTLGIKDSIVKSDSAPDEILKKVNIYLGGGKTAENPFSKGGSQILAVEDDNFLRDLLSRKLGHENCDFIAAVDGETALKILETETPSIILLDLILPGIDGYEVLEKIKSNPKTKNIPVVILSNLGQESDIEKAKKLGADDFLIKANFSIDEVIGKIKKLV